MVPRTTRSRCARARSIRGSLTVALILPLVVGQLQAQDSATELTGIWGATRDFGPEARGPLILTDHPDGWRAEIGGFYVSATNQNGQIVFELPDGRGEFRGRIEPQRSRIAGHWIQPRTAQNGRRMSSPVILEATGDGEWRGEVVPFEDALTFFLVVQPRKDGQVGAFLRNPERNLGVILNVDRLERSGDSVRLIGTFFRDSNEQVLARGTYDPERERLVLSLRGSQFEFERIDGDPQSPFYARGRNPGPYRYEPPPTAGDGWDVGTLEEAGIALEPIRELIETVVSAPAESLSTPYVHALLIARHGKLVLEEYFHGFDRETPHDTRSASKSLTAVLVGAAIESGAPLKVTSSVYDVVYGDELPAETDARKRRMTVGHLLTMTSGFDCDDRDPDSPGNENRMQQQTDEPDWYEFTLSLPMAREPGATAVYCSANPNLLGAVLSTATGKSVAELIQRLVAEPLDMDRYHLFLTPTDRVYMGGGIHFLPRDFMKLGQLMLDGGVWNGRRVVSEDWAARSISPLQELRRRHYGYLWWVMDYPYRGNSVRAFFAGGNGGQIVMGIPELDLLVTFFAGNYSDPVMYRIQDEFVPRFILPAVEESNR